MIQTSLICNVGSTPILGNIPTVFVFLYGLFYIVDFLLELRILELYFHKVEPSHKNGDSCGFAQTLFYFPVYSLVLQWVPVSCLLTQMEDTGLAEEVTCGSAYTPQAKTMSPRSVTHVYKYHFMLLNIQLDLFYL
jgi:hypothetical protein